MAVTRLDRLLVAEGAEVTQGQLLAEFADTAMKDAAAAQAEAALAEAEAQLARLRAAGRPSEIEAQRARVEAIGAQEEIALRDAERAERLVPTGAGAVAAADRSRAIATRLAAEKREAMAALESLLSSRPEDIALAEARVAGARAASAKARADAELARVRAPGPFYGYSCGPGIKWARMACWNWPIFPAWKSWPMFMKPICRACAWAQQRKSLCPERQRASPRA
jgi:HlyD family secretion protein